MKPGMPKVERKGKQHYEELYYNVRS